MNSSARATLLLSPLTASHLHPGEPCGTPGIFIPFCTCQSSAIVAKMKLGHTACSHVYSPFPSPQPCGYFLSCQTDQIQRSQQGCSLKCSQKTHPTISALRNGAGGALRVCFYGDIALEVMPPSVGSACLGLFTCCLEKAVLSLWYKRGFSNKKPSPFPNELAA